MLKPVMAMVSRLGMRSLSTQLVVWNTVMLALLLGTLGAGLKLAVRHTIMASVEQQLLQQTQPHGPPPPDHDLHAPGQRDDRARVADDRRPPAPPGGFDPNAPFAGKGGPGEGQGVWPRHREPSHLDDQFRLHFFGLDGKSPFPFDHSSILDRQGFEIAKAGHLPPHFGTVTISGEPVYVISRPMMDHGIVRAVAQAGYPLTDINSALASLDGVLLTLIPVALICAALAARVLTKRILSRVRRMTHAAATMGARDFSERIPVSGQDEFSELAETFNGLLGRLQSSIDQQRRFTADASHELKSPLTIIQGNTGMALGNPTDAEGCRDALMEIDRAAETMSVLVKDLLLLARSDAGRLGGERIEVFVREILDRALSGLRKPGTARVCLSIDDPSLAIQGSEEELVRLFANLLNNALQHTPESGCVTVSAEVENGMVAVRVADTGSGIAHEHLPHLGERFYRVDSARARIDGGTGLGLSICKSIAEAHGGRIEFESEPGKGTTVTVRLPAA